MLAETNREVRHQVTATTRFRVSTLMLIVTPHGSGRRAGGRRVSLRMIRRRHEGLRNGWVAGIRPSG